VIGVDVVGLARFSEALERSPALEERLFTKRERVYCRSKTQPVLHLAGTLAAKEAVIKALGLGPLVAWGPRIEVLRDESGAPRALIGGASPAPSVDISISHDAGVAVAVALAR
jgi:holo-[acyl-carrier protein] synthase